MNSDEDNKYKWPLEIRKIHERMGELADEMNDELNHPPMVEDVRVAFIIIALPLLKIVDADDETAGLQPFLPGPMMEFGNMAAQGDPTGAKIKLLQRALDRNIDLRNEEAERETKQ